jgi:hypothetical protein
MQRVSREVNRIGNDDPRSIDAVLRAEEQPVPLAQRDGHRRVGGVVAVDSGIAVELVESAAHFGCHPAPGDEPEAAMRPGDHVGAAQGPEVGRRCGRFA